MGFLTITSKFNQLEACIRFYSKLNWHLPYVFKNVYEIIWSNKIIRKLSAVVIIIHICKK